MSTSFSEQIEMDLNEIQLHKKIGEVKDHHLHWFLFCYTEDLIERYGIASEKAQSFINEVIGKTKKEVEQWLDAVWENSN